MSMPAPPPDTRAAGQGGHIADHNTMSDGIAALESAVGALQAGTAVPPLTPTVVMTANYTASPGDLVPCDVSAGGFTVKMPSGAPDKSKVSVKIINTSPTVFNLLTVQTQGSDVFNKSGGPASGTLQLLNQASTFQYNAALQIWYDISDDIPLSQLDLRYLPQPATVQALSNSSTITPNVVPGFDVYPVTETGNVSGIILAAPGAGAAMVVTVLNRSNFTITFAAAGTSHVADGVSDIIPALTSRTFYWDAGTSLWYRAA